MLILAKIVAFFTGALGRWLAIAGLAVALTGAAYVKGRLDCSSAAEVRQLESAVKTLKAELALRDARTAADNGAREADRLTRERLDARNKELIDELEDPDRACLDAGDTERLRGLWRGAR